MEKVAVKFGTLEVGNGGIVNDTRQDVEFTGEKLGEYREYGTDRRGKITDTRGITETLYRAEDGRFVVHTNEWSRWQGEPNTESLNVVTEEDLQPGGGYPGLGAACGFGRALTLEEAIGPRGTEPPAVRETSSGVFRDWVRNNPGLQNVLVKQVNREELTLIFRRRDSDAAGLLIDAVLTRLFGEDAKDEAIWPRMVPDRPGAVVEVGEFEDVPEITLTVRLGVSDSELSDAISDFNHALCDYGAHLDGEETPLGRLRLALLKVRRDED